MFIASEKNTSQCLDESDYANISISISLEENWHLIDVTVKRAPLKKIHKKKIHLHFKIPRYFLSRSANDFVFFFCTSSSSVIT